MTNPDHAVIGILVDRSGSMNSCRSDMEGGINSLIKDQAAQPGTADVSIAQFDTMYESVISRVPIADVKPYVLNPRGGTALLDGMGRFITEVGEGLAAQPEDERPGKVIIVVVTDGYENSSHEWTRADIKKLVEQQQNDYGWEFVFLGANMDAVDEGSSIGIQHTSSMTFDAGSPVAMAAAYDSTSSYLSSVRGGVKAAFSDTDRKKATSK